MLQEEFCKNSKNLTLVLSPSQTKESDKIDLFKKFFFSQTSNHDRMMLSDNYVDHWRSNKIASSDFL